MSDPFSTIMSAARSGQGFGEAAERHFGLYSGVVADRQDPEEKGRVTVELKWIDPDYVTTWAPVAQIYAGAGYGAYWIPEVGDQVIIAFLRGELRKPIILGSIYSKDVKPPFAKSGSEDPKVLRTKAGHMLLMEDQDQPRIRLVDMTGGNEVEINSDENIVTVRAADHVVVEAGGNVQVDAGGSASINASQDILLSAGGSITIEASSAVTITGASVAIN